MAYIMTTKQDIVIGITLYLWMVFSLLGMATKISLQISQPSVRQVWTELWCLQTPSMMNATTVIPVTMTLTLNILIAIVRQLTILIHLDHLQIYQSAFQIPVAPKSILTECTVSFLVIMMMIAKLLLRFRMVLGMQFASKTFSSLQTMSVLLPLTRT